MSKTAVIAFVMPVIGALPAASGAEAAHPPPGVAVTRHMVVADSSAILRYWTAERMRHAHTPPAWPRSGDGRPAFRRTGSAAPGRPVAGRGQVPWAVSGSVRATTGKVFFNVGGGDFVCSAGTISAASRDLVVTAGHCAQIATGAWAQRWLYVPGYDQGRRPYGGFAARQMFVPTPWSQRHDEDYDVAMVALSPSEGRHVADVVGAQGIAFGQQQAGAVVYGFGYPIGGRYDGERLAYCRGRTHPDAHRITHDQGIHCDMAEGASGGPWLTRFDARTGVGVVTSVNSFKYADDPATMYGPYFGPEIRRVYDEAQRS